MPTFQMLMQSSMRVRWCLLSLFTPETEPAMGESGQSLRALQMVPSSSVQLSVQQIWRPCCSLCLPFQAYQSTPQRALKDSSGDRKSVHVISRVSVRFAFCFDTWALAKCLRGLWREAPWHCIQEAQKDFLLKESTQLQANVFTWPTNIALACPTAYCCLPARAQLNLEGS